MDEDEIIEKLMTLSAKRLQNEEQNLMFQDFVEGLVYSQLESLVISRVLFSDGSQVINSIFRGLTFKSSSQKKRVKLFELLLLEFHNKEIPPKNVSAILAWLIVEIDKLSTPHLIKICDLCVEYVSKSENSHQTSWKDIIPKILSVLMSKEEINHYGTDMSGETYKNQVVTAICQANWSAPILSSLAAMFVHIPLNNEGHAKVVNKLCTHLKDLAPEEVPPFTHQLLNLTKNQGSLPVFFALKQYYNKHIYHLHDSSGMLDSDKEAMREELSEDIKTSIKEVLESQAMVFYHVEQAANRSMNCANELVKASKACIPCGEVFFDPFSLSLLLILSNVAAYETQVLDTLKNTIVRLIVEEHKRNESDWLRKILNSYCNIESVITMIIRNGVCEFESVLRGLVSLSMALLKAGSKQDRISKTVSQFGRMIAVNIIIRHSPVAGILLESIVNNIMCSPQVIQYTSCLGELCDNSPLLVIEHMQTVNRLLESLPSLPQATASRVIYCVVSLIRASSKIRDNLILILRKSLFLHDVSARKVAVTGFLQLLKRLKLKGMQSLSQNSFQTYSCPSVFTQTVIDVHSQPTTGNNLTNNEGLCLEVINILKRCFTQQLSIKITLYSGLHGAILNNPELCCIPITDIFLDHLNNYFEPNEEAIPPLNFDKAITVNQTEVVVHEPLGYLVFIIQQIIMTSEQLLGVVDDEDYHANCSKLHEMMNSLIKGFSKCQLKHLDIDDEIPGTLEGKLQEEKLRHCISVYQALIAYKIAKWDVHSTSEDVKAFLGLFRAQHSLEDFARNHKPTKKEEASQKKKSKDTTVISNGPGKKLINLSETVMDFETVQRMLSLILCESVPWCTDEVAKEFKGKKPIYRFALQCCLDVLTKAKNKLVEHRSKSTFKNVSTLAKVIFQNLICKFEEVLNFDIASVILGTEIFTESCAIIFNNYSRQMTKYLSIVTESEQDAGLDGLLEMISKPYLKTLSKSVSCDENEDDPNWKKMNAALIIGINLFANEMPVVGLCINKVYRWLINLVQTNKFNSPADVKILVSLLLTLYSRSKSEGSLHDNLSLQLCSLFGSISDGELEQVTVNLSIVNDATKAVVFPILCQSLNSRLDAVDWIIVRVKAELALISQPDASQTDPQSRRAVLKRKEKDLVTELGIVVSACQWMCTAAVPQACAEPTCKLLHHTYSCLTSFTKYFMDRGGQEYQEARFSKLVKMAASHLSTQVAEFLLYVESVDDENSTKKVSITAIRHAKKQMIYIPKLVAELENFTKCVTQLSVRSKDPSLVSNVKLTTTRDFRLNIKRLEEIMKNRDEEIDNFETTQTSTQASLNASNHSAEDASPTKSPKPSTSQGKTKRKGSNSKTTSTTKRRKTK